MVLQPEVIILLHDKNKKLTWHSVIPTLILTLTHAINTLVISACLYQKNYSNLANAISSFPDYINHMHFLSPRT